MSKHERLMVNGKPFFALGGQVHNASGYAIKDLEQAIECVHLFGGNSIAIPVYWEQIEPEEGQFDCSIVGEIIDRCREEKLRVIFLWFGTWKNGTMKYVPAWVKRDTERFHRVLTPTGYKTSVLSSHCQANFDADKAAFVRLMGYIKDKDEAEGTVVAVQVENEPGIIGGTVRDFGPEGEAAMAEPVPGKLMDYLRGRTDSPVYQIWQAAGAAAAGDWETVFGDDGSEIMTAWSIAHYINAIAAAGKAVYDLPMYVNVWLDFAGWDVPGLSYPSGGAVTKVLDVWKCDTPDIDFIAPDDYKSDMETYSHILDVYDRPDNVLHVPESQCYGPGPNVRGIFKAIADHNSMGHHVFGVECFLDNEGDIREDRIPILKSLSMVSDALPLIERYSGTGRITAITQNDFIACQYYEFGDWMCLVEFGKGDGKGWNQMDYLHLDDVNGPDDPGRGLVFQVADNEFYIVGDAIRLHFNRKCKGGHISPLLSTEFLQMRSVNYATLTEGAFDEAGNYCINRYRSGDENDFGVWMSYDVGVVHVELTD